MFDNIRKLFRRGDDFIPLPPGFDPEIFREVMERAKTPQQQTRVLRTVYHLTRLWPAGKAVHIPRAMVMVNAAYPRLARMSNLEIFGTEWLAELAVVMQLTAGSTDGLASQPESFRQLLREALENLKPD